MPIEFNCHVCGKLLRTSEEKAGRTAKCPGCGESLIVPQTEGGAAEDHGGDEYGDDYGDEADEFSASPSGGATRPCPMCGEQIKVSASRCRFCGEDVGGEFSSRTSSYQQPHRGALILTFGILSFFVCIIFGIVAWVMANTDLNEMQAGRMDPEGEGLTRAGKIVAIVSLSLAAAGLVLYCLFVILVVAMGAA